MEPAPPELHVGAVLGGSYELVRPIGRGGMGQVWEARHLRLPGKRVAVKVLITTGTLHGESLARFRREAEIASRLDHPGIVRVSDFDVLPSGAPFLVMDLLEGESLGTRLLRGPLPLDEALDVTRQIGEALAAAHAAKVIHRDLKPDNVFLCQPGSGETRARVKVLDFGISKLVDASTEITQDAKVLGTPRYMSPEQARGDHAALDARTDVFSLGAILYELITGRAVFAGESVPEIVFKVVFKPHDQLTGAPAAVVHAVDQALAKERAQRFASVRDFLAALEPAAGQSSTAQVVVGDGRRRGRLVVVAGATAALAMGSIMAVIALRATPVVVLPADAGPAVVTVPDAAAPPAPLADAAPPATLDAAPSAPDAAPPGSPTTPRPGKPGITGDTPDDPTAAKLLGEAEALLAQGHADDAARRATRSLSERMSPRQRDRARVLLVRAACKLQDLGEARAQIDKLSGSSRRELVRQCAADGVLLPP